MDNMKVQAIGVLAVWSLVGVLLGYATGGDSLHLLLDSQVAIFVLGLLIGWASSWRLIETLHKSISLLLSAHENRHAELEGQRDGNKVVGLIVGAKAEM